MDEIVDELLTLLLTASSPLLPPNKIHIFLNDPAMDAWTFRPSQHHVWELKWILYHIHYSINIS